MGFIKRGGGGSVRLARTVMAVVFVLLVAAVSGGAAVTSQKAAVAQAAGFYQSIPRANCGPGSNPEDGFQGEVTAAERAAGFQGFSCNLQLVGQSQGEGASWQNAWYGHCDYYDTADNQGEAGTGIGAQQHLGVVVLDVTDPAHPTPTTYLQSPAMMHPWESLKVNDRRALLAGDLTAGTPFDVYDISQDCAHPKLLASVPMPDNGHEGEWEPDGMTYWASSTSDYHAIDVTDPYHPKELLKWTTPAGTTHGMSFSPDGTRAYFVQMGSGPNGQNDGLYIADISDIQYRRPEPQVRILSHILWPDGSYAQHTIPVFYNGKPYLIFVDELGSGGLGTDGTRGWSCANTLPPFGHPRIFDISDEKNPKQVSTLTLQTDDPANCQTAVAETNNQVIFGYDSHYCSVDHEVDPTALACGYFNSGLRIFDIRNPAQPKEIAYFNPPAQQTKQAQLRGSEHASISGIDADWCSSRSRFFNAPDGNSYLWAQCQDNGFMVLKFTNGAYPLPALATASSPAASAAAAPAQPAQSPAANPMAHLAAFAHLPAPVAPPAQAAPVPPAAPPVASSPPATQGGSSSKPAAAPAAPAPVGPVGALAVLGLLAEAAVLGGVAALRRR